MEDNEDKLLPLLGKLGAVMIFAVIFTVLISIIGIVTTGAWSIIQNFLGG